MEVRINKEVRNYQESLFFGLSLRQFLFALLAVLVALAVYFCLHPVLGTGEIGWVCILAAFPFALGGFFTYNGMTLERFLMAYIRSEFFMPKVFKMAISSSLELTIMVSEDKRLKAATMTIKKSITDIASFSIATALKNSPSLSCQVR